ncbi:deoxyribonuclease V [Photobacterium nomapromontoriensis]|uniref:deoxyribonuclease V n=1 Tax=Photobacterium nomapromontoriensis TaxID=2910237 RepID=UPI003D12CCDA
MTPVIFHPWNLTEDAALQLQVDLASKVEKQDRFDFIRYIAGADVAYSKESDKLVAAIVILDAQTLEVIETATATTQVEFPYIPGLFSFRELPPLLKALSKLKHKPDLIVCDGQGYAHPRRFGLACHLGVILDLPTIGCGKKRLIGKYQEPDEQRGSASPLIDENEIIGNVLRTQTNINPVYISIGNRVSLETACKWILKLSQKYRLPETTRQADQLVNFLLKTK